MNNKGFTLIELLVTIGLIAIVSTIVIINMTGLQSNVNEKEIERFENKIISAGCQYIDRGQGIAGADLDLAESNNSSCSSNDIKSRDDCKRNGCYVCLSTLIREGLIDEDLHDPRNGKKVNEEEDSIRVLIKWGTTSDDYKQKECSFVGGV